MTVNFEIILEPARMSMVGDEARQIDSEFAQNLNGLGQSTESDVCRAVARS